MQTVIRTSLQLAIFPTGQKINRSTPNKVPYSNYPNKSRILVLMNTILKNMVRFLNKIC